MTLKTALTCGLLAIALLLTPAATWADVIHFRDGRALEVEIIEEGKTFVVVEVRSGSTTGQMRFDKDDILRIERARTDWDELLAQHAVKRASAKGSKSVDEWEALARWCEDNKLHKQRAEAVEEAFKIHEQRALSENSVEALKRLFAWCHSFGLHDSPLEKRAARHMLTLDPNEPTARAALGYSEFQGKWLLKKDFEIAYERHMREKGMVEYRGKWYTPEALEAYVKALQADELIERVKRLESNQGKLVAEIRGLERENSRLRGSIETIATRIGTIEGSLSRLWDCYNSLRVCDCDH